jgi:hypothetical protein
VLGKVPTLRLKQLSMSVYRNTVEEFVVYCCTDLMCLTALLFVIIHVRKPFLMNVGAF